MIALTFSWKVLWRIRFTDTALSFSVVKGLFLHLLCYAVYAKSNTILDIQTQVPRHTRLAALRSSSNRHNVVLQSVQRFSEAVCRLQLHNSLRLFLVNLPSYPNPGCVVCLWLFV